MKKYYTLLLLLGLVFQLSAQKIDWELGMFIGGAVYQGDLTSKLVDLKQASPGIGFTARYKYYYTFNIRANLLITKLSAADSENTKRPTDRGYSFESSLVEFSGMAEYEPFGKLRELKGGKNKLPVSPYFLGGLGFCFSNPKPQFAATDDPAVESAISQDLRGGFSKIHLVVPIGMGLRYDINRDWMIGAEVAARYPFTDYLDGISKAANPGAKDWYWFFGIAAMHNFR